MAQWNPQKKQKQGQKHHRSQSIHVSLQAHCLDKGLVDGSSIAQQVHRQRIPWHRLQVLQLVKLHWVSIVKSKCLYYDYMPCCILSATSLREERWSTDMLWAEGQLFTLPTMHRPIQENTSHTMWPLSVSPELMAPSPMFTAKRFAVWPMRPGFHTVVAPQKEA